MSKRHILNHKIIEENAKWQLIKLERSTLVALVMLFYVPLMFWGIKDTC